RRHRQPERRDRRARTRAVRDDRRRSDRAGAGGAAREAAARGGLLRGGSTSMSPEASDTIVKKKQELRDAGVRYCIGAYVDIHGRPKAKCVPIEHFEHMMHGSELFTGYALDGLGQEPNDDEISAQPDLDRLIRIPWRKDVAWLPADNYFHGEPYPLSTRVVLRRVLAEAEAMGFT